MQDERKKIEEAVEVTLESLAERWDHLEQRLKETAEPIRDSLRKVSETSDAIHQTFDIKHQIERHPLLAVGVALAGGFLVEANLRGTRSVGSNVRARFSPEIEIVRGIAIGLIQTTLMTIMGEVVSRWAAPKSE